jgi:hypothetical protein
MWKICLADDASECGIFIRNVVQDPEQAHIGGKTQKPVGIIGGTLWKESLT